MLRLPGARHRHWNCPKKQCHGCYEYGHVAHCCPGNPKGEFFDPEYLFRVAAGAAQAVKIPNVLKIPVPTKFVPYWECDRRAKEEQAKTFVPAPPPQKNVWNARREPLPPPMPKAGTPESVNNALNQALHVLDNLFGVFSDLDAQRAKVDDRECQLEVVLAKVRKDCARLKRLQSQRDIIAQIEVLRRSIKRSAEEPEDAPEPKKTSELS